MSETRVGVIRCDTHAGYYAVLMDDADMVLFRSGFDRDRKYTWQAGGLALYLCTNYFAPYELTVPKVDGFSIVKVWDEDRAAAERFKQLLKGRPAICDSFEEVSDDVDLVFVSDCNGDGGDKLRLASPGIQKRVPTFLDKPLSYEYHDAKAIVELARRHDTPILSLSILREVPCAARFKGRFEEIGEPGFAVIKGLGKAMASQIHAISLAQNLFGFGVETVESMGADGPEFVHLEYGGKPGKPLHGVMLNCDTSLTPHCALYASVFGKGGAIHSHDIGDYEFPYGAIEILKKSKRMVETRQPQAPYAEMLENIAVATAARVAWKEKRRVNIGEIANFNCP